MEIANGCHPCVATDLTNLYSPPGIKTEGWRSRPTGFSQHGGLPRDGDAAGQSAKRSGLRQPFGSQEGIMARRDFPLSINRRRLMTAAAAVTATGSILPVVKRADAAAAPDFPISTTNA
jgi:hypothetical protein